ncbi:hypothetical protein PVAND_000367 [Polypedilum vanderplanki]|uniref:Alpha 1,4-glycosyltransferase domain-containing protein n=1 Tax=Polypedilum vanderplanki TaxID=319348 RepID=A0A9J6BK22_POLVA|nr:hypothetical protein PVAND_000367 [Polypedilum vanderplanki]
MLQKNAKEEKNFDGEDFFVVENYLIDFVRLNNSNSQQIFFIETHLSGRRTLNSSREVCSIESAARINPTLDIYFLLMTDQDEVVLDQTPQLEVLLSYPNIRIRFANITEFTRGTIVEKFFAENFVGKSEFRLEHTSDIIRMLVLNKFGGLYLDHDVLSVYPIKLLVDKNFGCLETSNKFNNAIIKLDKIEGKKYSDLYLEQVVKHYDPENWAGNGPDQVTAAFKTYCNDLNLDVNQTSTCDKITAIKSEKCFLYMWWEFKEFYEEESTEEGLRKLAKNSPYFIHIWNSSLKFYEHNNYNESMSDDSKTLYMELAKSLCPKTIKMTETF